MNYDKGYYVTSESVNEIKLKHPDLNEQEIKSLYTYLPDRKKLLNGKEEHEIDLEIKSKEKISKETSANLTTRLKKMILSVDGNSDKAFINNFVDNEFLSRDSYPFRENLLKITPDIDMKIKVKDSNGEDAEVMLPITLRFFWPSSGI